MPMRRVALDTSTPPGTHDDEPGNPGNIDINASRPSQRRCYRPVHDFAMSPWLRATLFCVGGLAGASAGWAQDWEHVRVIGQRLGVPRIVTVGSPPSQSIAIGDFDGDGDADIAVSGANARRVSVLLGDASSPFTATLVAPRTDWPTTDADTAVDDVGYRIQSTPLSAITTVTSRAQRGPHNGGLAVVADFDADGVVEITPAPPGSSALAIGDFDADGFADLVASGGRSTSLTLLFGDGHGRFTRRHTIDVGVAAAPAGLAAGDINDDSVADVALVSDSDTVSVFLGDGAGGLVPMTHVTTDRAPPSTGAALATTSGDPAEYQGIVSLTLNPTTIAGGSGATSTGTVTLNAPAPAGGVVVTLASSNIELAASVASITVPAGATTASFTIGTNKNYRRYSGLAFNVTISATHGATTRSATLALSAQARPGTLSNFDVHNEGLMCFGVGVRPVGSGYELEFGSAGNLFNCVPPPNPVGQDGTCTFRQECALGCQLRPPQDGFKFRDVCAASGPFPVAVNPKLVVGGNPSTATLRLNAAAPPSSSGILSSHTLLANTIPSTRIPIPAGATTATAEVLTARVLSPQFAPIDGSYYTPNADGSINGRIGLTWAALTPGVAPPFRLRSFQFDPPTMTSVVGGQVLFAVGQMNQVAPAPNIASVTMTVTSSHPTVAEVVRPNVTVTEGSSSAAVSIQTHAVSADTVVTISATVGETTLTRQLLVKATPGATGVNSFFLDPFDVEGGSPSTGTVVLNGAAPAGGAQVTLQSSNPAVASMPASVTVPAGSDRTNFTITTAPVSSNTTVTLTANYNGGWAATSLIVTPGASSGPTLTSLAVTPTSVVGGNNATGTVTMSGAAPSGGAVVSLSSSNAAATVPAGVTVAAGATSATFTATTSAVGASTPVTISATHAGVTRTASLTVTPAGSQTATATLTVTATGRTGERVTSSPAGINVAVGSTGSASFTAGASITLSVTNGRDAIWSGACSSSGNKTRNCTFTLKANASVTANVQ